MSISRVTFQIWLFLSLLTLISSQEYENGFIDRASVPDVSYRVLHDYKSSQSKRTQHQGEYPRKRRQYSYREAIGPVHTFVKTDEHAHFKWGVRHHVG